MKIILFSDIHANLPALKGFFQDIEKLNADFIYCLGDLVGYNIWPNETIQEIRKRKISVIAGNYDQGIGQASDDCGCAYKSELERELGKISISYTNSIIQEQEREFLKTLPFHISVTFHFQKGPLNLLLVHGSPRRINEYLFEDREEKSLLRIMKEAKADIMCFGHTHKPYHRILSTDQKAFYHAINVGSVGKPKDGNPQGGYVLLTLDHTSSILESTSISVDFIRFDYDVEEAAKAIEKSPLPDQYADMLRKAY